MKIHARNVPQTVTALLDLYRAEKVPDESFAEFAARLPDARARQVLQPFADGLPAEDERHLDWDKAEPFSTDDLGVGECAGAAEDAAADPFQNYCSELDQSTQFLARGQWADALAHLNRSQFTLARALLDALGKRPESDYEVACELRAQVINRGFASELWNDMHEEIAHAMRTKHPEPVRVRAIQSRTADLLDEARRVRPGLARRSASAGAADYPG